MQHSDPFVAAKHKLIGSIKMQISGLDENTLEYSPNLMHNNPQLVPIGHVRNLCLTTFHPFLHKRMPQLSVNQAIVLSENVQLVTASYH
jgi:hypothetical protein